MFPCADVDECVSAPCQNGGTCVDQVNGYLCQCAPGYTDLQCQTGKTFCFVFKRICNIVHEITHVVQRNKLFNSDNLKKR